MSKDGAQTEHGDAKAASGGKKKLIIAAAAVILLGGGGFGAYSYLQQPAAPGAKKAPAKHEAKESKEGGESKGKEGERADVYSLEPFVVNLADQGEMHYLKIKLELQLANEEQKSEVSENLISVKDQIITLLSAKGMLELQTPDGKNKLKADIIAAVNSVLPSKGVSKVYYTDFVLQ